MIVKVDEVSRICQNQLLFLDCFAVDDRGRCLAKVDPVQVALFGQVYFRRILRRHFNRAFHCLIVLFAGFCVRVAERCRCEGDISVLGSISRLCVTNHQIRAGIRGHVDGNHAVIRLIVIAKFVCPYGCIRGFIEDFQFRLALPSADE